MLIPIPSPPSAFEVRVDFPNQELACSIEVVGKYQKPWKGPFFKLLIFHSMESFGNSYNNALAETIIGLYKTKLIYKLVPGVGWSKRSLGLSIGWIGSNNITRQHC
jgi:hypothetical protein